MTLTPLRIGFLPLVDAALPIAAQTLTSVEAVGKAISAGTNCGSCRPAITRLLQNENAYA